MTCPDTHQACLLPAAVRSACSAKKRPRVAAAPERYADLVSNMTSQGGADDTDSDADDAGDRHEVSNMVTGSASSLTGLTKHAVKT